MSDRALQTTAAPADNGPLAPMTRDVPAAPHYAILRPQTLDVPATTQASRISRPAEHRVLYFPGEQTENWASEGSREVLRVKSDEIENNPFSPESRGGANIVMGPGRQPPTAREYVAPAQSAAEAASRLRAPRADGENTALSQGLYRTAEYRVAKVKTQQGMVVGMVRPLGVIGTDPRSVAAAQQALNRSAGEHLVYFPHDFGWGGFVPEDPAPFNQ